MVCAPWLSLAILDLPIIDPRKSVLIRGKTLRAKENPPVFEAGGPDPKAIFG
jgi:hypothetical protein